MNLLIQSMLMDLQELARAKGAQRFRVDHKRNASGELVLAILIADTEGPFAADKTEPRPRGRVER